MALGGAIGTSNASCRVAHLYLAVTGTPETWSPQIALCASLVESATLTKQWVVFIAHVIAKHLKLVLSARVHAMDTVAFDPLNTMTRIAMTRIDTFSTTTRTRMIGTGMTKDEWY